ncbi:MAG: DMT family transporter [Nocardioidaceae bacterium]|nr:DMT family transporter [Nocardioidaceae bacterium]
MVVLLALGSAAAYGISDFAGGILSRRSSPWAVAVAAQASAAVLTLLVATLSWGDPEPAAWAWGALSGVGGGFGAAFLYRGLGAGSMTVVAPVSAVGAALLPVAVGIASGERPNALTWIGVACAFPAIWLVSLAIEAPGGTHAPRRRGRAGELTDGLLAGLGFGLLFSALGQVRDTAGLGPLAMSYAVSVPATIVLAIMLGASWVPRGRAAVQAVGVGVFGTAATVLFLLAAQTGLLTVAAVMSSLYPATTVLLAAVLLHERIGKAQGLGLLLAGCAVGLVAAG